MTLVRSLAVFVAAAVLLAAWRDPSHSGGARARRRGPLFRHRPSSRRPTPLLGCQPSRLSSWQTLQSRPPGWPVPSAGPHSPSTRRWCGTACANTAQQGVKREVACQLVLPRRLMPAAVAIATRHGHRHTHDRDIHRHHLHPPAPSVQQEASENMGMGGTMQPTATPVHGHCRRCHSTLPPQVTLRPPPRRLPVRRGRHMACPPAALTLTMMLLRMPLRQWTL